MSYFTQMAGLAYHNFASAAVGIALAIALIRGIARREIEDHRKFLGGSDALHAVGAAAVLLIALVLVSQGVVQNLKPYDTAKIVEPQTGADHREPTARPVGATANR
jgi:potassium-transporting ATPase potassium-binding subunit